MKWVLGPEPKGGSRLLSLGEPDLFLLGSTGRAFGPARLLVSPGVRQAVPESWLRLPVVHGGGSSQGASSRSMIDRAKSMSSSACGSGTVFRR